MFNEHAIFCIFNDILHFVHHNYFNYTNIHRKAVIGSNLLRVAPIY